MRVVHFKLWKGVLEASLDNIAVLGDEVVLHRRVNLHDVAPAAPNIVIHDAPTSDVEFISQLHGRSTTPSKNVSQPPRAEVGRSMTMKECVRSSKVRPY